MNHRMLFALLGFVVGALLILIPIYIVVTSNKTVFTSDKTPINEPQTAVTRTLLLENKNNPYQITMTVTFDVKEKPQQPTTHLFSYIASISNSNDDPIEQKSSTFSYTYDETGKKTQTVTLFTEKKLPTDTYGISVVIRPILEKNPSITLSNFSYEIKSNIASINPLIPIVGLVLLPIAYLLLPKKKKEVVTPSSSTI